jgi:hypothetical protein
VSVIDWDKAESRIAGTGPWVPAMIYLHNHQRLRKCPQPPPLVPFAERGAKVRDSL